MLQINRWLMMNIELKIALVTVTITLFTLASYGLVALHA
ncbi:hypothetical protein PMAL9190_00112 [Photobacterium malacitanum]|uniref:Uncharacterized protein n=2 Tax=Photobacterium TaxID=657 RepID=A0A1Y6M4W5_9GAMM|nr:hypothetical protein PMAL9190_00112 [Photobacterium malacitanum]